MAKSSHTRQKLVELTAALAEEILLGTSQRTKKQDPIRALISELAERLVRLEGRIARLEQFTRFFVQSIPQEKDILSALLQSRADDPESKTFKIK